jgi:hypothetical protein
VSLRRPATTALAIALLALAGCDGDDSSNEASTPAATPADAEAAVEETWATFVGAAQKGDGQVACAGLSEELARPGEVNFQLGSILPGGPSCEETLSDKQATASFTAALPEDFAELTVDGATADGIAGVAKPTFAETDGEWEITSFFGVLPEE